MVKLLRLTTDDDRGIFQANFKNPITINPNSKLALLQFTAQVRLQTLIVDFENNEITFRIAGNNYVCRINRGTYGRANYMDLLQDIQNVLNLNCIYSSALGNTSILGVEWLVEDIDNKINIRYGFNKSNVNFNLLSLAPDITTLNDNNDFQLSTAKTNPQPNYDNAIIGKKYLSLGNGYVRTRIRKMTGQDTNITDLKFQGFLIGLSNSDLTSRNPASLTEDDITYGFGVGFDGTNWVYYSQDKGVVDSTGITPKYVNVNNTQNGALEIMKNGDKVELAIYDGNVNGGDRTVLRFVNITENEELFPFVVFHSNLDMVQIRELRWLPTLSNQITVNELQEEGGGLSAPPLNRGNSIFSQITFGSITLAEFLGYNNIQTPLVKAKTHNFIANNEFDVKKLLNTYLLELLNLNVESYDSNKEQRKNIIASILTSDENGIINNEGNVIFIDINNKEKIDLRNISLRLVGLDFTPVLLDGRSICALLIGGENETSF